MTALRPCPVCHHQPSMHGSMVSDTESIGCNWDPHCPQIGSFDFMTDYLPIGEAIAEWNSAVEAYR